MKNFTELLEQESFSKDDIIRILSSKGEEEQLLMQKAHELRLANIGNKIYLRGLIEISNICSKNCYYCGIRKGNKNVSRYLLSDKEVLKAAQYAYENDFGSLVIQGGELESDAWTGRIENLLREIKKLSNNELGITLSLGEQSEDTFRRWYDAGAHRYLLRFESSDHDLYHKIHPNDALHSYKRRMEAIDLLRKCNYQVGTGVMIGLPWQNVEILAEDLLRMKELDIDMCGMGPYVEHHDTPLYKFKDELIPLEERFSLSLKMIATLRLLIHDINIAGTTAMQTIDPEGREKAFKAGANVVMPNITPTEYKDSYLLYDNKPGTKDEKEDSTQKVIKIIKESGFEPGTGIWGDSPHFKKRSK
ncbi:MAG: [FeFe] hydrogenase H-cluster radical SAM maturase HydE [Bacteroidales bacterium]|nr:[FeFe] hydrogenase H-cluster radical SAM maturase HydE [Bacteroidales bacterium]